MLYRSLGIFFFFKQKTAYEMRISDWSSDVCSSDLPESDLRRAKGNDSRANFLASACSGRTSSSCRRASTSPDPASTGPVHASNRALFRFPACRAVSCPSRAQAPPLRSEEHTSELQSLMRIPYAVFCLKKKKN